MKKNTIDDIFPISSLNKSISEQLDESAENFANNIIKDAKKNGQEAGLISKQAIQFLNAANSTSDRQQNRPKWRRFLGKITGGNNKLRDIAQQHDREALRATMKVVEKISQNQVLLVNSIQTCQQMISYIHHKQVELKEWLYDRFVQIDDRFEEAEKHILLNKKNIIDLKVNVNKLADRIIVGNWQTHIDLPGKHLHIMRKSGNHITLLFAIISDFFRIKPNWISSADINDLRVAVRNMGFDLEKRYSWQDIINYFIEDISESADYLTSLKSLRAFYPINQYSGITEPHSALAQLLWNIKVESSETLYDLIMDCTDVPEYITIDELIYQLISGYSLCSSHGEISSQHQFMAEEIVPLIAKSSTQSVKRILNNIDNQHSSTIKNIEESGWTIELARNVLDANIVLTSNQNESPKDSGHLSIIWDVKSQVPLIKSMIGNVIRDNHKGYSENGDNIVTNYDIHWRTYNDDVEKHANSIATTITTLDGI